MKGFCLLFVRIHRLEEYLEWKSQIAMRSTFCVLHSLDFCDDFSDTRFDLNTNWFLMSARYEPRFFPLDKFYLILSINVIEIISVTLEMKGVKRQTDIYEL